MRRGRNGLVCGMLRECDACRSTCECVQLKCPVVGICQSDIRANVENVLQWSNIGVKSAWVRQFMSVNTANCKASSC